MIRKTLLGVILTLILVVAFMGCSRNVDSFTNGEISDSGTRGTMSQVSSFGSNPGNLAMYKYVPSGMSSNAALVVAMHGCTQSAADYSNSGWKDMAELYKFYVVFPETNSSNNQNKCFNWFEPGDIARGQGEAQSVKSMIDKMKADYSIDSAKVFVNGFSAGGYMAPVIYATYPDVIKGMSTNSGGPYKCATSMTQAFTCMSPGVDKTAAQWGTLVKDASTYESQISGKKVVIFQGSNDYTVKQMNATELQEQWQNVGATVTKNILAIGHNVPIDTASGCGSGYSYTDNTTGRCSAREAAQAWGIASGGGGGGDTTAPTTSLTAPAAGATLSGTVTLSASASDNVGVTKVAFYMGSTKVGEDTSSPYSISWNSANISNGTYSLTSKAYDAAGNVGTSSARSVTVSNGVSSCNSCTTSACCQNAGCTGYMYVYPKGNVCYLQNASTGWQVTVCSCWQ